MKRESLPEPRSSAVVPFRPRQAKARPPAVSLIPEMPQGDTAESDDYRQRMLTNAAGFAIAAALTAGGVWLAVSLADLRRAQDCVLTGRRDCARLAPAEAAPGTPYRPHSIAILRD